MSGSQSLLEFIENPEDAKEQWIYIGQTLYEPLLINELDGLVYQFYEGPPLEKGNVMVHLIVFVELCIWKEI